jgi:putative tricarboxylic transport membrane protein
MVLIPFGRVAIKLARRILQTPRNVLMPIILAFCVAGVFASVNAVRGITAMPVSASW